MPDETDTKNNETVKDDPFDFHPDEEATPAATGRDSNPQASTANDAATDSEHGSKDHDEPKFDASLLERAKEAGFDEDDFSIFPDEATLKHALEVVERRAADRSTANVPEGKTSQQAPTAKSKPAKFDLRLNEALLDKEVIEQLSAMNEHYSGIMEQIASNHDKFMDEQRKEFRNQRIEALLANAPDDLQAQLKKPRKRQQVVDQVDILEEGYKAKGRKVPMLQDLVDSALRSVFADQQASIARRNVERQIRNRQGQFTNRPTRRETDFDSRQAAIRDVQAILDAQNSGRELVSDAHNGALG